MVLLCMTVCKHYTFMLLLSLTPLETSWISSSFLPFFLFVVLSEDTLERLLPVLLFHCKSEFSVCSTSRDWSRWKTLLCAMVSWAGYFRPFLHYKKYCLAIQTKPLFLPRQPRSFLWLVSRQKGGEKKKRSNKCIPIPAPNCTVSVRFPGADVWVPKRIRIQLLLRFGQSIVFDAICDAHQRSCTLRLRRVGGVSWGTAFKAQSVGMGYSSEICFLWESFPISSSTIWGLKEAQGDRSSILLSWSSKALLPPHPTSFNCGISVVIEKGSSLNWCFPGLQSGESLRMRKGSPWLRAFT